MERLTITRVSVVHFLIRLLNVCLTNGTNENDTHFGID